MKTKTKHESVVKPLKELLPSNIDIKQFKDDLLNGCKEEVISTKHNAIIRSYS